MSNKLLEEIRHECRNGTASIKYEIKVLMRMASVLSTSLAMISNEIDRIERAVNFLDVIERKNKRTEDVDEGGVPFKVG